MSSCPGLDLASPPLRPTHVRSRKGVRNHWGALSPFTFSGSTLFFCPREPRAGTIRRILHCGERRSQNSRHARTPRTQFAPCFDLATQQGLGSQATAFRWFVRTESRPARMFEVVVTNVLVFPMKPHEIHGVSPFASKAEIDKAYRRLAAESHPDAGGDPANFKVLFSTLSRVCVQGLASKRPRPVLLPGRRYEMNRKCPSCGERLEKTNREHDSLGNGSNQVRRVTACCRAHCDSIPGCHVEPDTLQRQMNSAVEDAFLRPGEL